MNTEELCGARTERGLNQTTASGKPFWCGDPRPEDVRIEDIAAQLSRECRFGGALASHMAMGSPLALCPVETYSVAQHSVLVCDNVADPALKLAALLHDVAEAYCKDIPKPIKTLLCQTPEMVDEIVRLLSGHVVGRGALSLAAEISDLMPNYGRVEQRVANAIFDRFGLDRDLMDHPAIAEADYRAVLTEKRDLLPPCPGVDWGTPRAEPFPERIVPLLPSQASALFLQRFRELYRGE